MMILGVNKYDSYPSKMITNYHAGGVMGIRLEGKPPILLRKEDYDKSLKDLGIFLKEIKREDDSLTRNFWGVR